MLGSKFRCEAKSGEDDGKRQWIFALWVVAASSQLSAGCAQNS
jgi:hypothetical protein